LIYDGISRYDEGALDIFSPKNYHQCYLNFRLALLHRGLPYLLTNISSSTDEKEALKQLKLGEDTAKELIDLLLSYSI